MNNLKNGLYLFYTLMMVIALASFIKICNIENNIQDMTKQIESQQDKLNIDLLRIKNQMKMYNVLIDHQQQRLARIDKVREVIKKTLANHYKNHPYEDDTNKLSREEIYKMATYIIDYTDKYDVPTSLMLGMLRQESGFDPNAVSPTGALGLAQIVPSTAEHIKKKLNIDEYDAFTMKNNIQFGAYYLSKMLDHFEDNYILALQAYNQGPDTIDKYLKGEVKILPHEATNYSAMVMKYATQYSENGVH